jgi:hypothetical protein
MNLPRLFSLESEYYKAITLAELKFSKDLLSDLKRDTAGLRSGWSEMRQRHLSGKAATHKETSASTAAAKKQKRKEKH